MFFRSMVLTFLTGAILLIPSGKTLQEKESIPEPRSFCGLVPLPGDRLLVFQGWNGETWFDDAWEFSLATRAWRRVVLDGKRPAPREGLAVAPSRDSKTVLVFGGCRGPFHLGDLHRLDLETLRWEPIQQDIGRPEPRCNASLVETGLGRYFLGFGFNFQQRYLAGCWAFEGVSRQWTRVLVPGTVPGARYGQVAGYDEAGKRVLTWGGGQWNDYANDLWFLDLAAGTWGEGTQSGSIPAPRAFATASLAPDERALYLFGGYNGKEFFGGSSRLDLETLQWSRLPSEGDSPAPRNGHAAAWWKDRGVVVFGGRDGSGFFNDLWLWQRTTRSWLKLT